MFNELFGSLFQEAKKEIDTTTPEGRREAQKGKTPEQIKKEDERVAKLEKEFMPSSNIGANKKRDKQAASGARKLDKDKRETEAEKLSDEESELTATTHHGKVWEKEKAEYGSFYVKNNPSSVGFISEVENLPFRTSGDKSATFFGAIKERFEDILRKKASAEADPAFGELWAFLKYSPKPAFRSTDYADFNTNMPPFVLFLTFAFPLLEQNIITTLFSKANITKRFTVLQNSYSGSVLNHIEFTPETDFKSCEHIKDPKVKLFVKQLQQILMSDTPETELAKHELLAGLKSLTATLIEGSKKAIGNAKHINEVARTIYYSILSATVPSNLDLFELNDEEIQAKYTNPREKKYEILTKKAYDLIANYKIIKLEDAMTTRGTLGKNTREALAFAYAKETKRLKKSNKNTETSKVREFRAIHKDTLAFFHDGLKNLPDLSIYVDSIQNVLSDFFPEKIKSKAVSIGKDIEKTKENNKEVDLENERDTKLEPIIDGAYEKLHDYAVVGLDKLQVIDAGPFTVVITDLFNKLLAITKEDLDILLKLSIFINLTENRMMKVSELKKFIRVVYKNHYDSVMTNPNSNRVDGFTYFRSILGLDELLLSAEKLMRLSPKDEKSKEDKTKTVCPKCNGKGSVINSRTGKEEKCPTCYGLGKVDTKNASRDFLRSLLDARIRIHQTRDVLDKLGTTAEDMYEQIHRAVRNADINLRNSLVSGTDETDIEPTSAFIDHLANAVLYTYFRTEASPNNPLNYTQHIDYKPSQKLYLLASEDVDLDNAKETIVNDLTEKSKNGTLATEGVFNTHLNYYSGLNQDFIDFINLAASITQAYSGLTTTPDGKVELNFKIGPATNSNSFFGSFFFGDLSQAIQTSPAVKLCFHKFILSKISLLVAPQIAAVSSKKILLPEVQKRNPEACKQIDEYFSELYKTLTSGIKIAISEIDNQIIDIAGNTSQKIVLSAEQNEYHIVFIPGTKDEAFENATNLLGNKAAVLLNKEHGVKKSDQLFFNSLLVNKAFETKKDAIAIQKGTPEQYIVERIQDALNIIATAINLKAAKYSIMGNDEEDKLLSQLLNKYRKEKATEKEDKVITNINLAKNMLSKFTKDSGGLSGTDLVQQDNNRIKNPVLTKILDKFNKFMSYESFEKELLRYSSQEQELASKGQTDYPMTVKDTGESSKDIILKTLGIMYIDTVENPSDEVLSAEPIQAKEKEVKEEGIPTEQLFNQDEHGVLKFNFSAVKTVTKSLTNKIRGYNISSLGKEKRYGTNVIPVKSYTQYINELKGAISIASNRFIDFYYGIGSKQEGDEVKISSKQALNNCKVLDDFFRIIANPNTGPSVLNIGIQQKLLDTLEKLQPIGALAEKDSTVAKKSGIAPPLSLLFSLQKFESTTKKPESTPLNTEANKAAITPEEKIDKVYSVYKGSRHVLTLIGNGYTPTQISDKVNTILIEKKDAPEFLALADDDVFERLSLNKEEEPTVSDITPIPSKVAEQQPYEGATLPGYFITSMSGGNKGKKVNPNFLIGYINSLDPATYSAPNSVISKQEKEKYKENAISILNNLKSIAGTEDGQLLQNEIAKLLKTGTAKNSRLGTAVSSVITDSSQLPVNITETFLELAKRLLEDNTIPEGAENQETKKIARIEPNKEAQKIETESNEILIELAAILRVNYGVSGSDAGLLTRDGKPFTFSFLSEAYWLLPMFDQTLNSAIQTITKFVKSSENLQFQVSVTRLQQYSYIPVYHFASIKLLIDKYYKLNSEVK